MSVQRTEALANEFFQDQSDWLESQGVFKAPERIYEAYATKSLIGAAVDSDELPHDLRQFARNCRDEFRQSVGVNEYRFETASGTGGMFRDWQDKVITPHLSLMTLDRPTAFVEAQLTGDCTLPSAMVSMADGTRKRIDAVREGDMVVSHKGRARRVVGVVRKPPSAPKMVQLTTRQQDTPLVATPDHQIVVVDGDERVWKPISEVAVGESLLLGRVIDECVTKLQTLDVAEFCGREWVDDHPDPALRLNPASPGMIRLKRTRYSCRRFIELDDRLAWLLGIYSAEGSTDFTENGSGEPARITLNFGSHREVDADKACCYFKEIFGVEASVSSVPSKPSVVYVRVCNYAVAALLHGMVHGNVYAKSVDPRLLTSPVHVRRAFLRGWFDGDGCVSKHGFGVGVTASQDLAQQVFDIANSVGVRCRKKYEAATESSRESWRIQFRSGEIGCLYRDHETPSRGGVATSVRQVTSTALCDGIDSEVVQIDHVDAPSEVFCLVVDEDQSFICDGYAVHNCVSVALRSARDIARSYDIVELKQAEEYVKRSASADLYSMRGHTGAGASPSRIAVAATKIGILLETKIESPDGEIWDFTNYRDYYKIGIKFGRTGLPQWIFDLNREYGPKQVAECHSLDEVITALWNGCGVGIGSMMGVSKHGGKDGTPFLSALDGSWAHEMCILFADTRRKYHRDIIVGLDQTWGNWNHIKDADWPEEYGPKPEGAFCLTGTDLEKYIRSGEVHALSDSHGFRPRRQRTLGSEGLI